MKATLGVERGSTIAPMQRGRSTVAIDGLVTVRDLGGLRRADGSLTPFGVFLRSENVDAVTERGWEQLRDLGVRTVVDLRQPGERERDVNGRPSWLTTCTVDLDGLENAEFWKDYWENGLVGTALYYLPHLTALPERSGAALSAIATAPPGGVLFHCMGGRDRTGMIAMLLLLAANADPEEIVSDYMETIRRGELRAAHGKRPNDEPELEEFCRSHGTTTEQAFRDALESVDIDTVLANAGVPPADRRLLETWRGTLASSVNTL
jgi:protein tyrosine/serine phosphatase